MSLIEEIKEMWNDTTYPAPGRLYLGFIVFLIINILVKVVYCIL